MRELLAVAAGGALGALGRYWLATAAQRIGGSGFPYGTLTVNWVGSLLIGVLFVAFERSGLHQDLRLLLTVGLLGAFTTFSTFALETLVLIEQGAWGRALANILANVILCLLACAIGVLIARRLG